MNLELSSWNTFTSNDVRKYFRVFTSIPGYKFESASKKWVFPLDQYDNLLGKLKQEFGPSWLTPNEQAKHLIPGSVFELVSKVPRQDQIAKLPVILERAVSFDQNLAAGKKKQTKSTAENSMVCGLEPKILDKLLPFQVEGVKRAIRWQGRILIADEMGVGKSVQALAICSYYRAEWPFLIVCPSSLVASWTEQIKSWFPQSIDNPEHDICPIYSGKEIKVKLQPEGFEPPPPPGTKAKRVTKKSKAEKEAKADTSAEPEPPKVLIKPKAYVMSYDLAVKAHQELRKMKIKIVVADESHCLRNRSTKRTKFICPIINRANRKILLSGTPALSRPVELYSQLQLIMDVFPKFQEFGIRYCAGVRGMFGWDYRGASHQTELSLILEKFILIRRTKAEVLSQLPPKVREQVFLHCDKEVYDKRTGSGGKRLAELSAVVEPIIKCLQNFQTQQLSGDGLGDAISEEVGASLNSVQNDPAIMELWKLTGKVKMPAMKEYVKFLLENHDGKILLFAHHRDILDEFDAFIRELGSGKKGKKVGEDNEEDEEEGDGDEEVAKDTDDKTFTHIRIDGHTPSHLRFELCDKFQTDEKCRIALLSITAAGVGITLTRASRVVFAELYWNPGILMQAEDRAHRIGQRDCVRVQYLLARGTFDDTFWPIICRKLDVLQAVGLAAPGGNEFSDSKSIELDADSNVVTGGEGGAGISKRQRKLDEFMVKSTRPRNEFDTINNNNSNDNINSESISNGSNSSDSVILVSEKAEINGKSPSKNKSKLSDNDDDFASPKKKWVHPITKMKAKAAVKKVLDAALDSAPAGSSLSDKSTITSLLMPSSIRKASYSTISSSSSASSSVTNNTPSIHSINSINSINSSNSNTTKKGNNFDNFFENDDIDDDDLNAMMDNIESSVN